MQAILDFSLERVSVVLAPREVLGDPGHILPQQGSTTAIHLCSRLEIRGNLLTIDSGCLSWRFAGAAFDCTASGGCRRSTRVLDEKLLESHQHQSALYNRVSRRGAASTTTTLTRHPAKMAQPTPDDANGVVLPDSPASGHLAASGKRKRDNGDDTGDGMDVDVDRALDDGHDDSQSDRTPEPHEDTAKNRELVKAFFEALRRYGLHPLPLLTTASKQPSPICNP